MVIELNAKPGLSIQLANICGLKNKLKLVNRIIDKNHSPLERIQNALKIYEVNNT